jgi:hypothetical protein
MTTTMEHVTDQERAADRPNARMPRKKHRYAFRVATDRRGPQDAGAGKGLTKRRVGLKAIEARLRSQHQEPVMKYFTNPAANRSSY